MKKTVMVDQVEIGQGQPKIIVPIVGTNSQDILDAANNISKIDCDFVEWRIDHYKEVKDVKAVATLSYKVKDILKKPLLVTFRSEREGGVCALSDQEYGNLYLSLIEEGKLDLLDVELFMPENIVKIIVNKAHQKGIKVIMCNHDFDKTPAQETIVDRLKMMEAKGADICKIAVMPQSKDDVLTLLQATAIADDQVACPLITMSMGSLGMVSRVSGEVFGSAATFGSAGQASAPGQVPVSLLRDILTTFKLN